MFGTMTGIVYTAEMENACSGTKALLSCSTIRQNERKYILARTFYICFDSARNDHAVHNNSFIGIIQLYSTQQTIWLGFPRLERNQQNRSIKWKWNITLEHSKRVRLTAFRMTVHKLCSMIDSHTKVLRRRFIRNEFEFPPKFFHLTWFWNNEHSNEEKMCVCFQ